MVYNAEVNVMLRPAILDVQGKTVENALKSLGYGGAEHVRIGKHISFEVVADSAGEAERIAGEIAERVLSNPVMENFTVTIREAVGEESQ